MARRGRRERLTRRSRDVEDLDLNTLQDLERLMKLAGESKFVEKQQKQKLSFLQRAGSLLSSFEPGQAVYSSRYEGEGFLPAYAKSIGRGFKEAITGRRKPGQEEKKTFKDVLVKEGWKDRPGKVDPADVLGLGLDIGLDPTTYLGGAGLLTKGSKGGKLLSQSGKKLISEGVSPQLIERAIMKKSGLANKYLKGLTFMGKEIPGATRGRVRKFVGKPFELAGKVPVIGPATAKAISKTRDLFRPGAAIKSIPGVGEEAWDMFSQYYKASRGKVDKFIRESQQFAKETIPEAVGRGAGKREAFETYSDIARIALEKDLPTKTKTTPLASTGNKELDKFIAKMQVDFKKMAKGERARGLLKKIINQGYFPRILTEEFRDFMSQGKIDVNNFLREFSTSLGSSKARNIFKVFDADGNMRIANIKKLGLKRIDKGALIKRIEEGASKKTAALQKALERVLRKDIDAETKGLQGVIDLLKSQLPKKERAWTVSDDLLEPTQKEYDDIVASIVNPKKEDLNIIIKELEVDVLTSGGKEFLYQPIGSRATKKQLVKKLQSEILQTQQRASDAIADVFKHDLIGKDKKMYASETATISEINKLSQERFGMKMFEENAFNAYLKRGINSVRAIESYDFIARIGDRFGVGSLEEGAPGIRYVEGTQDALKGKYIPKEIAQELAKVSGALGSDSAIKDFMRMYDKALSFFKASVYGWVPASHTTNAIGGMFNNWLAGLKNPIRYKQAQDFLKGKLQTIALKDGTKLTQDMLRKEIDDIGMLGQSGYLDVMRAQDEMFPGSIKGKILQGPRNFMEGIEDRLRSALYIDQRIKGATPKDAMAETIKYHFDYMPEGLSGFEKNVVKRFIPFYTWTRNQIPLTLQSIVEQPGKMSMVHKTARAMGSENLTDDELPFYLRNKFYIPISKNENGDIRMISNLKIPIEDSYGVLDDPMKTVLEMLVPFAKTPIEVTEDINFFKDIKISEDNAGSSYKNAPGVVKNFLKYRERHEETKEGKKYTVYRVDPYRKYLLENFPFTTRFVSIARRLFDTTDDPKNLLSLITSLKEYQIDKEKQEYFRKIEVLEPYLKALNNLNIIGTYKRPYIRGSAKDEFNVK